MNDKQKMTNPAGRPTARDALAYADAIHGLCTVTKKGLRRNGTIAFRCVCGVTYVIGASQFAIDALRNVLEDKAL